MVVLPLLVISTPNKPVKDPADKVVVALVTVSPTPESVLKLKVPTVVVAASGAMVGLAPGLVSLPRKVAAGRIAKVPETHESEALSASPPVHAPGSTAPLPPHAIDAISA